jgi:hypothetical protein
MFYNKQWIKGLKEYPAVYAWYLADEPDLWGVDYTILEPAYSTIKSLDPKRLIAIAFPATEALGTLQTYAKAMDIYMPDFYPITTLNEARLPSKQFDGFAGWVSYDDPSRPIICPPYPTLMDQLRENADALGKTLYIVLQAYGDWVDFAKDLQGHAWPSLAEERYMIYAAMQKARPAGLFFWPKDDGDPVGATTVWVNAKLSPPLTEFEIYVESFANGPVGAVVVDHNIDTAPVIATLYKDADFDAGEFYVLLLIHHGPEDGLKATGKFQDPQIVPPTMIFNSVDMPLPPVDAGKFEVELGPYEVRIYKFGVGVPVIEVDVVINDIKDHVLGTPEQLALLKTFAKVKIGDSYEGTLYEGALNAGQPGSAQLPKGIGEATIQIEIWRQTSRKVVHGTVDKTGQYVVFGKDKYPLPDGFENLPPNVQAELTTMFIQPDVSPGLVRTVTLDFDLLAQKLTGDLNGDAGQQLHIESIPGPQAPTPDVWLTVTSKNIP